MTDKQIYKTAEAVFGSLGVTKDNSPTLWKEGIIPFPKKLKQAVKLLNKSDLVNKVRITKLDMADCHKCVLGQIYGDFLDGLISTGIEDRFPELSSAFDYCSLSGEAFAEFKNNVDETVLNNRVTGGFVWSKFLDIVWKNVIRELAGRKVVIPTIKSLKWGNKNGM